MTTTPTRTLAALSVAHLLALAACLAADLADACPECDPDSDACPLTAADWRGIAWSADTAAGIVAAATVAGGAALDFDSPADALRALADAMDAG